MTCLNAYVKCVLRRLTDRAIRKHRYTIAGALASLLASIETRQRFRLRWDGEDWIYSWRTGGAVNSHPFWRPRTIDELLLIFLFHYKLSSGDTIVDVGVENGDEIPSFCQMVGPLGRVIAIEADPACCRRLRKLKDHLSLGNLTIVAAAVGAADGFAEFSQDLASFANQVVRAKSETRQTIRVPMRTLSNILGDEGLETVQFLKVNIEGAEVELLQGMPRNVKIVHVCISCHDFIGPSLQTFATVHAWLAGNGYQVTRMSPEDHRRPWQNYYLYGQLTAT